MKHLFLINLNNILVIENLNEIFSRYALKIGVNIIYEGENFR